MVILDKILSEPASTAAFVAALLALVGGVGGPLVQLLIGRKQAEAANRSAQAAFVTANNAGSRAIAAIRVAWIDQLRKTLAEYHSILMSASPSSPADTDKLSPWSDEDDRRLSNLGTQIELMLNPNEGPSQRLLEIFNRIYGCSDLHTAAGC
jgi:hypothetical protein